jgi:hypothetical protein
MHLKPDRVPEPFRRWIPLAERWGIGDDYEREAAVDEADAAALEELLALREDFDDIALWLAGPESHSKSPTPEYIAFTCLTMAWESAKVKVNQG